LTDWRQVRSEFPALAEWTYLNTATFGQLPCRAREAVERHFEQRDRLACMDFMSWFDDADRIRALVARFINCSASDIAFIPNASAALSLLMGGIDWKPGDEVVTLESEFPNHYYYASHLERAGVTFVESTVDRLFEKISPSTRLVAISSVNYSTGQRPPLVEIGAYLRERGVLFYLDGTQSLGALRMDIRSVMPDVYAVHGYKWLLSPTGAGFMYVSAAVRQWLEPNVIGWRSHRDWRSPENLHHGAPALKSEAERYEGGMLWFPLIYAMAASIEMMMEIGPAEIEDRVMRLAGIARDVLRRAGGRLPFDESPHYDSPVVTAGFTGRDASAIVRELRAHKVLVAARHGRLRVSPHFYNDESDLDRLDSTLRQVL
jgi:selenocysteine lyase/cysteine desulfurase